MSQSGPSSGRERSGPRRTALVTGASAGIGHAFAERLARESYDLILVARSRERLESLAKQLGESHGTEVEVLPADLTVPDDLRRVEERIAQERTLELVVNNAGFGTVGRFVELDPAEEEREIRLNVIALVRLSRAAVGAFVARGHGSVINVSSLAAFQPDPYNATYGATKAFVNSFTEALHEELRGTGVRVQALCPGFTRTEFQERAGIDASRVPSFAWMDPAPVVEESLAALRRGEVICVPGRRNQAVAAFSRLAPRSLTRRVAAAMGRRGIL
jgi:hypothetical protein